jgi:hypothetical protein
MNNGLAPAIREKHEQYGEAPGQAVIAGPALRRASEPLGRHTATLPALPGLLVLDLGCFFARCRACSWLSWSCATFAEALSAAEAHGCAGVNQLEASCSRP